MMEPTGEATATAVLDAADRLIGDLADAVPAFRAVGDALAVLADGLGVEKVIVAVDDARLGRQVFCSGRGPLGDLGVGLVGPIGAWTQPPRVLDAVAAAVLVRAVGAGVVRSTARGQAGALALRATSVQPSTTLTDAVTTATARAVRHGWGFTLVLVRGAAGVADALRPRMRASDLLVDSGGDEIAVILPQTAGDRVPQVLARLAEGGGGPPFSYGLACCPADGTEPALLLRTAAERLEAATRASESAAS